MGRNYLTVIGAALAVLGLTAIGAQFGQAKAQRKLDAAADTILVLQGRVADASARLRGELALRNAEAPERDRLRRERDAALAARGTAARNIPAKPIVTQPVDSIARWVAYAGSLEGVVRADSVALAKSDTVIATLERDTTRMARTIRETAGKLGAAETAAKTARQDLLNARAKLKPPKSGLRALLPGLTVAKDLASYDLATQRVTGGGSRVTIGLGWRFTF